MPPTRSYEQTTSENKAQKKLSTRQPKGTSTTTPFLKSHSTNGSTTHNESITTSNATRATSPYKEQPSIAALTTSSAPRSSAQKPATTTGSSTSLAVNKPTGLSNITIATSKKESTTKSSKLSYTNKITATKNTVTVPSTQTTTQEKAARASTTPAAFVAANESTTLTSATPESFPSAQPERLPNTTKGMKTMFLEKLGGKIVTVLRDTNTPNIFCPKFFSPSPSSLLFIVKYENAEIFYLSKAAFKMLFQRVLYRVIENILFYSSRNLESLV